MTTLRLPTRSKGFAAWLILFVAALTAFGQETQPFDQNTSPLPAPTGFINDYAGVIDQATKDRLETKLKQFKEQTNPQVEIAVAVVRTTGERPIFDYSLAVARGWGIGIKADDNPSALLFIAIDDRKYFTQVSKDLEDELSDGTVGSLQRQFLVPEFRKGNYAKGIEDTVNAYLTTIENKGNAPTATPQRTPSGRPVGATGGIGIGSIVCCGIILLVIILLLVNRSKRGGGPGGGVMGDVGGAALPWIIGSVLSGSSSGSSSSWGGGSSDWGGSSGGGFGGFGGGGDFGGGGGGGDW